ncbi:hypothetical protein [Nonomuraea maheshkhaliensis]
MREVAFDVTALLQPCLEQEATREANSSTNPSSSPPGRALFT